MYNTSDVHRQYMSRHGPILYNTNAQGRLVPLGPGSIHDISSNKTPDVELIIPSTPLHI